MLMNPLPNPIIEEHVVHGRKIRVVRDDLLPGGSKTRFLPVLIGESKEIVFGGPFCGGAPLALSVIGKQMGRKVTLFYAQRKEWHPRQLAAASNGAQIRFVYPGYMTNVQAKARAYTQNTPGALFLPLGFDVPEAGEAFVSVMEKLRTKIGDPPQIWCATGSGMLARSLAKAFPASEIQAVAVGLKSRWQHQKFASNVFVRQAPYAFEDLCKIAAPFPCCPNYDRKAWQIAEKEANDGSLFWNVLG